MNANEALLLPLDRRALVLAPSAQQGWFGGRHLVVSDPIEVHDDVSAAQAFEQLAATFDAEEEQITAALIGYDGRAIVHTYERSAASASETASDAAPTRLAHPADLREPSASLASGPLLRQAQAEMTAETYADAVRDTQQAILAGRIYVLNLTYRVRGVPVSAPPPLFEALNRRAPAPMAALFAHPDRSLASVSPERFMSAVRGADGVVVATTEPIKGTAPRCDSAQEDAASARSLAESAKERAEHVMIVDMERNDLGRVCIPGSVHVDPLFEVFATPYCHQMVSRVSGRLRANAGIAELLTATFPTGSITGAPKVAAMRHIERLEVSPRGAYTGILAVAMPDRLDSSVVIRSLEYDGDAAVWGTGCGITVDSDPMAEWNESVLKCSPVLDG